jgi:hypothetical protein
MAGGTSTAAATSSTSAAQTAPSAALRYTHTPAPPTREPDLSLVRRVYVGCHKSLFRPPELALMEIDAGTDSDILLLLVWRTLLFSLRMMLAVIWGQAGEANLNLHLSGCGKLRLIRSYQKK